MVAMIALLLSLKPPMSIVAPGATLHLLAGGFAFTEGPTNDPEGNIYFTDQPNDRIMKWSVDGTVTEWMKPCGRSNGMMMDKHGDILACADDKNELWKISPKKEATVLVKHFSGKLLNGPNDVWIRPDGGMYLTDPLYVRPYWHREAASQMSGQHVYFLPAGGKALVPVTNDLVVPNGIIGTPDGKTLYVGDLGQNEAFAYDVQKDGSLKNKRHYCQLGSDGMTIDEKGNVYFTGHGVSVFNPKGEQILHVDVPEPWCGNVAFGGKDHKLLFITASKGIYGLQMSVRGAY